MTAGQGRVPGDPFDARLLKMSFAHLEPQSEKVMAHFFATLFVRHPELRAVFPLAMEDNRRRVFAALARYVQGCDHPESLAPWLTQLARRHRRYDVDARLYQPFCEALLETVRVFSGDGWAPAVRDAWEIALGYLSAVMADAANGARDEPAWWVAEVTGHELRRPDLAVLTLRPDEALPYRPGQHVGIQVSRWPRIWREYSVANAPRPDGQLRLHVRAIPGGMVSPVLVHQTRIGDSVIVGQAQGEMTADALSSASILCVAGGTGLAPIKAILEALTGQARPAPHPGIRLLVGARTQADLYDLPSLRRLQHHHPSLEIISVVSHDPGYQGGVGTLADATAWHLRPTAGDVVICGPPAMVTETAATVRARAPGVRIHFDPPDPAASVRGPAAAG